jgi:hypothetical protein
MPLLLSINEDISGKANERTLSKYRAIPSHYLDKAAPKQTDPHAMCELFKTESSADWVAAPFHAYSGKGGLFFETRQLFHKMNNT